jgi:hypothetical protein
LGFFIVLYSTQALLHLQPIRFRCVSEDARIEIRTVATTALAVRRSTSFLILDTAGGSNRFFLSEL